MIHFSYLWFWFVLLMFWVLVALAQVFKLTSGNDIFHIIIMIESRYEITSDILKSTAVKGTAFLHSSIVLRCCGMWTQGFEIYKYISTQLSSVTYMLFWTQIILQWKAMESEWFSCGFGTLSFAFVKKWQNVAHHSVCHVVKELVTVDSLLNIPEEFHIYFLCNILYLLMEITDYITMIFVSILSWIFLPVTSNCILYVHHASSISKYFSNFSCMKIATVARFADVMYVLL